MSRIRSRPVTSGIWLSTSRTSKMRSPRIWRAALALSMATTSWPSSASALASSWRIFSSSSTMSTEPGDRRGVMVSWASVSRRPRRRRGRRGRRRRRDRPGTRKGEADGRTRAGLALDVDAAAEAIDDVLADRQADAGAAPLGGEERLEHPRHLDVGHADAAVGHRDFDVVVAVEPGSYVD